MQLTLSRHPRAVPLVSLLMWGLSGGAAMASMPNLITNPGFETQPLSPAWVANGGVGTLSATSTSVHDGSFASLTTGRTQTYSGPAQDITSRIVPGVNYTVSAYARASTVATQSLFMGLKVVDGAGTRYLTLDSFTVRDNRWYLLSGPLSLKVTAPFKQAVLYISGPATGADLYVDSVSLTAPEPYTVTPSTPTDFVRAQDGGLVVGADAQPFRMLGTNFNAYCDDTETAETVYASNSFSLADYQKVANLGLNVVRLNLTYKLFEDDANPYVYLERGFEYLEQNIIAARNANVYLMLSMMAPPGGYQSWGYSGTFWNTGSPYQARLIALWQAIAERYKDEPWIIGYDLLNEPSPNSNAQYISYMGQLTQAIRQVDSHHLLDVQEAFVSDSAPFVLADSNTMYDFHWYDPAEFVTQLQYRDGGHGDGGSYPDPQAYIFPYSYKNGALLQNPTIPTGTTGWTYYQGSLLKVTDSNAFAAVPTLISSSTAGKLTFDDFIVEEYDPQGTFVRRVHTVDIEKTPSTWYLLESWDPFLAFAEKFTGRALSGSGKKTTETTGHSGKNAISISSVTGKYIVQSPRLMFAVKQNYQYRISGWIKGDSVASGSGSFGLELKTFSSGTVREPVTKASLEARLLDYGLSYYLAAGVPVNIGEFGISPRAFSSNKGGERLMADMTDLFDLYDVSAQYFDFHSQDFGIYTNLYGFPDEAYLNQPLAQALSQASQALP